VKLVVLAATLGCVGPRAPHNQLGIAASPGAAGAEYEHFLAGDANTASWSVGLTLGVVWRGLDDLFEPKRAGATIVAFNPFVRWHAWRPTDWLSLGLDAKLSLVLVLPTDGDAKLVPSVESHTFVDGDYAWTYALVGVGVKHFLFGRDFDGARFPSSLTMPAGELAVGARF
jgi:hypothetical protein